MDGGIALPRVRCGAVMAVGMAFLPFCLSFPPREKWRSDTKESIRLRQTERERGEGFFPKGPKAGVDDDDDTRDKNPPPLTKWIDFFKAKSGKGHPDM